MSNHCIYVVCKKCNHNYCVRCEVGRCPKCGMKYSDQSVSHLGYKKVDKIVFIESKNQ